MLNISQVIQNLTFLVEKKKTGSSLGNPTPIVLSSRVTSRIKLGSSQYGKGDDLTSEFIKGLRLPKHSPAHHVYGEIEKTKWALSMILVCHLQESFLEEFEEYQIQWFIENLHSLGSYCFTWGSDESTNHIFPSSVLETLDRRIQYLQLDRVEDKSLADCQDFLSFKDIRLLWIDFARISFRKLESAYSEWYSTLFGLQKINNSKKETSALLNRSSTYLFYVTRHASLKLGIDEIYWTAKVTDYNPPTFEVKEDDEI